MHKLRYMALGGLLMFVGMLTASVLMPNLVAQRNRFGDIECTSLRVVDKDGMSRVEIGITSDGEDASIFVMDKKGVPQADISVEERRGGSIRVSNKLGEKSASLDVGLFGGRVGVRGKDMEGAKLGVDKHGGYLRVEGKKMQPKAAMGINERGNGAVSIWDKNGNRQ